MNEQRPEAAAISVEAEAVEVRALVVRAQARDLDAYNALVSRHQRRISSLVYNMTSSREDTEDLVQDVFVKGYHALPGFKGGSSFYTWIYRIAVNRTLNFLKKRKRISTGKISLDDVDRAIERDEEFIALTSRESPVRDLTISELQKKLNAALQTLSVNHRAVVVMHDIEGIPHDEIAKRLGTSTGTVRSRLFYARQQLQKELAEYAP